MTDSLTADFPSVVDFTKIPIPMTFGCLLNIALEKKSTYLYFAGVYYNRWFLEICKYVKYDLHFELCYHSSIGEFLCFLKF